MLIDANRRSEQRTRVGKPSGCIRGFVGIGTLDDVLAPMMATSTLLRRGIDSSRSRPDALVLAVVCNAQFMVVLDISIVNVALPDMKRDLGCATSAREGSP